MCIYIRIYNVAIIIVRFYSSNLIDYLTPLLVQFFACLLLIFGAEVAAGVFGFLNKDKVYHTPEIQQSLSIM